MRQTKALYFLAAGLMSALGLWLLFAGSLLGHPQARLIKEKQPPVALRQEAAVLPSFGRLPLRFEANRGQADPSVDFLARGAGYTLFLSGDESVISLRSLRASAAGQSELLRVRLLGANTAARARGEEALETRTHYFHGNNPSAWHTNIANYAKVRYPGVYPGIDLVYYGNQRRLEYDFVVHPGADPARIAMAVAGAQSLRLTATGDLLIENRGGAVRLHKPRVYQQFADEQREVEGGYRLMADNRVAFEVGRYDRSRPLVIDPVLNYSTYLGGTNEDAATAVAVDSAGNAYVTGVSASADFPATGNAGSARLGNQDVFVTKLDPTGTRVLYSAYLGGSDKDLAASIAVNREGEAYVAGSTLSQDFPLMRARFAVFGGAEDGFVVKLASDGASLVYSTYLGGSAADQANAIALDADGNAYIAGKTESPNFPLASPIQARCGSPWITCSADAFVSKLSSDGSSLVYSTYLGGRYADQANAIAVDSHGYAYVAGSTNSFDFPVVQAQQQGCEVGTNGQCTLKAFVARVQPDGSGLIYSTYLGGSAADQANAIAVDLQGNAAVAGHTSSPDFPVVNALQPQCQDVPCNDAFVARYGPEGLLRFASYLGGNGPDTANALSLDASGNAYVAGTTSSANFPVVAPVQAECSKSTDGQCTADAFVAFLAADGQSLGFSSYLGGSGIDQASGLAYAHPGVIVAGRSDSADFPVTAAISPKPQGVGEAFVTKIGDVRISTAASLPRSQVVACSGSESKTWIGITSTAWETASNWQPAAIPANTDTVCLGSSSFFPVINSAAVAAQITAVVPLTLQSGSLTLGANASAFGARYVQNGGTLVLPPGGTMDISGGSPPTGPYSVVWAGGTIQGISGTGGGTITTDSIDLSGSGKNLYYGVTLTNTGAGVMGSGGYVNMYDGAVFNNSGTLDLNNDNYFGDSGGGTAALFNNSGTLNRQLGTGDFRINTQFNNTGTVNVYSGQFSLNGGGTSSGFLTPLSTGATLNLGGGTHNLTASFLIPTSAPAPGTVLFSSGTVNINGGTYMVSGKTWVSGATVTFASAATVSAVGQLVVDGGTVNFNSGEAIAPTSISVTGGNLRGADNFTTSGQLTFGGGTIAGSTSSTLTAATIALNGNGKTLDGRKIINTGTATDSASYLAFANGASFDNNVGATFNENSDHSYNFYNNGGTAANSFNNLGTFTRYTAGAGASNSNVPFNNSGTVTVSNGTLNLNNGGSNTGTISVSAGAAIAFYGDFTIGGTLTNSGSASWTGGGTSSITGTYDASSGSTSVSGGTANFTGPITGLTSIGVSGGTANFSSSTTSLFPTTVAISGGTFTGTSAIYASGALTWTGGTLAGATGSTQPYFGSAGLTAGTSGKTLSNRHLYFSGSGSITGSYIYLGGGAIFEVQEGATLTFTAPSNFYNTTGGGVVVVGAAGNLVANTSGTVGIDPAFNNGGSVSVSGGILNLSGGGTSTGTYSVATELHFYGNHDLSGVIQGAGIVAFDGGSSTFGLSGATRTFNVTGSTIVTGGAVVFAPGSTMTSVGALTVSGGTAQFNSGAALAPVSLALNGGTLTGADQINIQGNMSWGGGTLSGVTAAPSNSITNVAGTLTLGGSARYLDHRTLTAQSSLALSVSGGYIYFYNGAILQNASTSTFNANRDYSFYNQSGGTFQNDGPMTVTAPSLVRYDIGFNNTNSVGVTTGVLQLNGGGTSSGSFSVASELDLSGTHALSGTISGAGQVVFQGGASTLSGTYNITGATVSNGGTNTYPAGAVMTSVGAMTVNGGTTAFNSGTEIKPASLALNGGTLTGSDVITVQGNMSWGGGTLSGPTAAPSNALATVNGSLSLGNSAHYLDRRTLSAKAGIGTAASGYIYFYNGAILQNASTSTFNAQLDYSFYNQSGGTFQNDGPMTVSSPSLLRVDIGFNNTNAVTLSTGVLELNGGGTSSGSFAVASELDLNGTHALSGTISGAGQVVFQGGTTNLSGTYNITGTTRSNGGVNTFTPGTVTTSVGAVIVAGGNLFFNSGSTVTPASVTLNGGLLSGTDAMTVQGNMSWGGGTLACPTSAPSNAVTTVNGSLSLGSSAHYLDHRTLAVATAISTGANGYIYFYNNAILQNSSTSTFTVQYDYAFYNQSGGTFQNDGALSDSAPSLLRFDIPFNNAGTVAVNTGVLGAYGGGTSSGSFTVASELDLGGGTHTLSGTISGAGQVVFQGGTAGVNGPYAITGATASSGGNTTFNASATVTSVGALQVTGGTLTLNSGEAIQPSSVLLQSGSLAGSDNITTSGAVTFEYGGRVAGPVVSNVPVSSFNANGPVTVNSYGYIDGKTFNSAASTTIGTNAYLYLANNAVFNNQLNSVFTAQSNYGLYVSAGTATFNNAGQFIRSAGTSNFEVDMPFQNTGLVRVDSGTLYLYYGTYTQTAGSTVLNGGSITAPYSGGLNIQGGALLGTGTIAGNVVSGGAVNPGTSPGAITISGNYTQTSSGSLNVEIGGLTAGTQYDTLSVSGTATLAGTLNITTINSYVPAAATSYAIISCGTCSGGFSNITGTSAGGGNFFSVGISSTAVVLSVTTGSPVPTISHISPAVMPTGSTAFSLTVDGFNFINGAVVQWNGNARTTTFVNTTQLIASIPSTDLQSAGTVPITVLNPPPPTGGTLSNAVNFTVVAAQGTLNIAANHVAAGGTARIPIFLTLSSGVTADTISFGIQVVPTTAATPAPALTTNMTFVKDPTAAASYPVPTIDAPSPDKVAVAWLNTLSPALTGSNVRLGDVVVTAPSGAVPGQTYTVSVTAASAALGATPVALAPGSAVSLTVTDTYLIGDTYPIVSGDDAGQFGDNTLQNIDLVYALRASSNFAPYAAPSCSDRFDAMDANGDAVLDTADLVVTLGRTVFPDLPRPRKGTRGLYCPAQVVGLRDDDPGYELLAQAGRGGTAGEEIVGALELGAAEPMSGGVRVPVYLKAGSADLDMIGLSVGIRLMPGVSGRSLHFANGNLGRPTLLDDLLPGKLSLAWLNGVRAVGNQLVLLGYVEVPGTDSASAALALQVTAVRANASGDGRRLRIEAPLPAISTRGTRQ